MRDYAGSALMVAITTLVGIGCYAASAHGAAQRDEIQKMRRQLVADTRAIRDLEAELRTRARLPQLERWNQDVLKMSAPAAGQFLRSPVHLASLVSPPKAETPAPALQYALAPATPDAAATPSLPSRPGVVQASYAAPAKPSRLVLNGFPDAGAAAPASERP
jgi:hypothetical protein